MDRRKKAKNNLHFKAHLKAGIFKQLRQNEVITDPQLWALMEKATTDGRRY